MANTSGTQPVLLPQGPVQALLLGLTKLPTQSTGQGNVLLQGSCSRKVPLATVQFAPPYASVVVMTYTSGSTPAPPPQVPLHTPLLCQVPTQSRGGQGLLFTHAAVSRVVPFAAGQLPPCKAGLLTENISG
jgi:hypothetical protein